MKRRQGTTRKRTRITRQDIETARQQLAEQPMTIRPKPEDDEPKLKKESWHGLVSCDSYGWCWIADFIDGEARSIRLGRTEEFIPFLKRHKIDGQNVLSVLHAHRLFAPEKKSHSCHSATETHDTAICTGVPKSIVATFKRDPRFLTLLESLASEDKGIRTIHSEITAEGYKVPMRTLGRWVKRRREESERLAVPAAR